MGVRSLSLTKPSNLLFCQYERSDPIDTDRVKECRIGCVKHRPVTPVDAELEQLVPLEHEYGFRIEPGCEHRCHPAPVAPEPSG